MITGVFARANHPSGYGFPGGKAHGYSVISIRCEDEAELSEVKKYLQTNPFYGIEGKLYSSGNMMEWYGGFFDLIATTESEIELYHSHERFVSFGDNRFAGIYEAADVFGQQLCDEPLDKPHWRCNKPTGHFGEHGRIY